MLNTRHGYRDYIFEIHYKPEDPAFRVHVLDFPEIITSGSSLAEAFEHACEAIDLHLETLQKLGLRVPRPKQKLTVQPV